MVRPPATLAASASPARVAALALPLLAHGDGQGLIFRRALVLAVGEDRDGDGLGQVGEVADDVDGAGTLAVVADGASGLAHAADHEAHAVALFGDRAARQGAAERGEAAQ